MSKYIKQKQKIKNCVFVSVDAAEALEVMSFSSDVRKLRKTALSDQASACEPILHMLTKSMQKNYTTYRNTHTHTRTSPAFPVARQSWNTAVEEGTREGAEKLGKDRRRKSKQRK